MSENKDVVTLETAERIANEIIAKVSPFCDRIEIVGSIRRRRPFVHDIDLLAIPRMTSVWSMFAPDDVMETHFADELRQLIVPMDFGQKIMRGGTRVKFAGQLSPISVDVYIATPDTWGTLEVIRTGSAEHNIWLASRAKACGGRLCADGSGLTMPGRYDERAMRAVGEVQIKAEKEEDMFSAMGLETPKPEEREMREGKPAWMKGRAA